MYIKKSIISGIVILIGVLVLLAVVVVYGFTEIQVPKMMCALVWSGCIYVVVHIVDRLSVQ